MVPFLNAIETGVPCQPWLFLQPTNPRPPPILKGVDCWGLAAGRKCAAENGAQSMAFRWLILTTSVFVEFWGIYQLDGAHQLLPRPHFEDQSMSCQKRDKLYRTGPDLILRPETLTNGRIMMSLDLQNGATSISHASYGPIAPTFYYPGKPTRHVDHFPLGKPWVSDRFQFSTSPFVKFPVACPRVLKKHDETRVVAFYHGRSTSMAHHVVPRSSALLRQRLKMFESRWHTSKPGTPRGLHPDNLQIIKPPQSHRERCTLLDGVNWS